MKAKSRKRLLISSVAMLLVAMLALGTATFAWFTSNPNANASGLTLKTTAAAGLVIRTDSDNVWSHNAELYKGVAGKFNLTPVSQDQATAANFWKVDAAAADAFTAKEDAEMAAGTVGSYTTNGDVYSEKVYFRLSDGSNPDEAADQSVKLVNITINKNADATMENAIRVAVADKAGKVIGTYALSTAGANGTLLTAAKTPGEFTPDLETTGAKTLPVTTAGALTATADDLSNYVTVYVYLDGQDSNCYSDKVGTVNAAEIISSIQLDFKLS